MGIISTSDITLSDITVYAEITGGVAGGIIGNVSMKGTTLSGTINIETVFTNCGMEGCIIGFDDGMPMIDISEGTIITVNGKPYDGI